MTSPPLGMYARMGMVLAVTLSLATPARAQYQPRPLPSAATGENFHIEGGFSIWSPGTDMQVASSGSGALAGIAGTTIDAKNDLGFVDQRVTEFQVTLRPAPPHKFRFQYIPIDYQASSTLSRTIDFNGQRYQVGLPVNSSLDWKTYRFGYEYDFFRRDSGYVGFIADLKYTQVNLSLQSPIISEFTQANAPIPAIGGTGRYYFLPNVAITGELTLFAVPTILNNYSGHYVDVDVYGTFNITNNFGVQGGYRALNLGYLAKQDTGSFVLKGIYVGVVARY